MQHSLRLLLFNGTGEPLPKVILNQILAIDRDAQMKNCWPSVIDMLAANSCTSPDVIVALFSNSDSVMRQIEELWRLRITHNYSPRPVYFAISRNLPSPLQRYEIERWGGHVLHTSDIATHFQSELAQIRLRMAAVVRSLPSWLIIQEGNGSTLQAIIYLVGRPRPVRIQGSDRLIAALAAFIKHNGIERSLKGWQKVLAEDTLFEPAGGGFKLPSIACLKMYLHRDFQKCLQQAFNEYQSGFCATRVIERTHPRTHMAKYRIRGEWEAIRR